MSETTPFTLLSSTKLSRRRFVTGMATSSAVIGLGLHARFANATKHNGPQRSAPPVLKGNVFQLNIGYQIVNLTGKEKLATTVNGSLPAPVLCFKEGETITLRVKNNLSHDSSIHWHGMILPTEMDGVPGLSFAGIKPGETYEYQFQVNQSGTYWYHSHSGFQEQTGLYGAIVIEPKEPDPVSYDRDHVILLSDWSDEIPEAIYAKLKKMSHYYNRRERTTTDLWRDVKEKGVGKTWDDRAMWNQMRMSDTDIADVTGETYTFLMNGMTPDDGFKALFKNGEKIRLRFINAAAMTIFDVRIPGLKMTVVASDGQNIEPVSVDEFRIGVAETYDVTVEPDGDSAYTIFAQSIDRTGFTRGILTSDVSLEAPIPTMDYAPTLAHSDMGMSMQGMDHGAMKNSSKPMDHGAMGHGSKPMDHRAMGHKVASNLGRAGFGTHSEIIHASTEFGPHVDMRTQIMQNGITDPGLGLRDHQQRYGRKVLTYADIRNLTPTIDKREPSREIQLHLTGNMSRYMWSINGTRFKDAEPLALKYGERVRIVLVNDTMMSHPLHLHGLWSELETGDAEYIPRKHTIMVQPGSSVSYLVSADAKGRWAYHCHLLYHMPGMMREVRVR